jgi:hypothetical protein
LTHGGIGLAFEDRGLDAAPRQFLQERQSLNEFRQSTSAGSAQLVGDDPSGGNRSDSASGNRGSIHRAEHHRVASSVALSAQLDAHRTWPAFGMGGPQHREPGRQSVTPSCRDTGSHPKNSFEGRNKDERVRQCRSIAILRADWFREPAQLTA